MTPNRVPYLCGGTLFSLILQARKTRTKARDRYNSGSDGLNDTDLMMGLVKVVTGDSFSESRGKTLGKTTSRFKTCQDYGSSYIPFTEPSVISAFNDSIKQKNSDIFARMSEFVSKYINDMRSEWLVKALFEVIHDDEDIPKDTVFAISNERNAKKSELNNITEVNLPVFLLSVIGYILNERKDNTKGRLTFEAWHSQSGHNSQWKYTGNVGNSITRKISVTTKYETDTSVTEDIQPHSGDVQNKTPHERIGDKILQSGQVLAATWGNIMQNLADELDGDSVSEHYSLEKADKINVNIPEVPSSKEFPYSSDDEMLLNEFTEDYDEIMVSLIGETYANSLIDMSLPSKIKDLYESKWKSKADCFSDPSLKSYVFGLLGELNNLSNSFFTSSSTHAVKSIRTKIRNLYVKLHPDKYSESFPYDVLIDDWNDGEF